ncbi:MAG: hypothetical protein R8K20_08930 [Gallionellaceae bacterium]
MYRFVKQFAFFLGLVLTSINSSYALDSYRFLHVTIETPWAIFIFLLFTIFAPFILMAVLAWRFAERKVEDEVEEQLPPQVKAEE